MSKTITLTAEGLKKIEKELELLTTVTRKEVAEKIKIARSFGDLSENSEYDEAKNEQARVEARISELESMLKNYTLIDESNIDSTKVNLGSKVRLLDKELKEEVTYTIVGKAEADPMNGTIS
ncbi:MAG: transcription elongation factor GreA, partial [Clostridia bacterium]|nr:transcription elongation factor GreA [Clostridia bacterium]